MRLPRHGFTTEELKCVVSFLQNYAEQNAVLLPGRIPGFKRTDLQLLPTETTKRAVWNAYMQSCATLTYRMAMYMTFTAIWRRYLPHIVITKPKTDLCWTCQQNSFAITASSNKSESEKAKVKTKFTLMMATDIILPNCRSWNQLSNILQQLKRNAPTIKVNVK